MQIILLFAALIAASIAVAVVLFSIWKVFIILLRVIAFIAACTVVLIWAFIARSLEYDNA